MTRAKRTALFVLFFSMAIVVGLEASARTERLRWTHPDPTGVEGYRVKYGAESGVYPWEVDVGKPATDPSETNRVVYVYDLDVSDAATVYVVVTAYAGGLESDPSNERMRSPSQEPGTGEPGDDPGSGGGGTLARANAAIDQFVLWDAQMGTVIDGDFTSGEQISVADYDCTAIEVVGNDYLSHKHTAGSVRFDFDGQAPSTCSISKGSSTHENEPPYTWEVDSRVDQIDCSPSLTVVGSHTLTVTPYDADDCSGAAGPSVSLSFEVIDAGTSGGGTAPAGQTLGTPGRPTLVLD